MSYTETLLDRLPSTCEGCELCYDNEYCLSKGKTILSSIVYRPIDCPNIEKEGSTNARL